MADTIVDGSNIDVSIISYSAPKAHASGGKVINVYNKNFKESLRISTPLMFTWGAKETEEFATKKLTGKWTMALQFPTQEYSNPGAEAFLKSMKAIETRIREDALVNSLAWLGENYNSTDPIEKKYNQKIVDNCFMPMLKHPKKDKNSSSKVVDETKPPTLTVKIPQWNGVWKPEIYDEDGNPLYINGQVNSHLTPLEFLKPKTHVICLIECGGLWFVNGKVSIVWNLKQAIVQKPKPAMEGTCFLKPKPADKEIMKALPPPEEFCGDEGGATIVNDSDDEYDLPVPQMQIKPVVQTPAPEPTPAPVPEPTPAPAPAQETTEEDKPTAVRKKITRKLKSDA